MAERGPQDPIAAAQEPGGVPRRRAEDRWPTDGDPGDWRPRVTLADTPRGYSRELEKLEISLLLEGIFTRYGFDFRSYAYTSLKRRLWKRILAEGLSTVSQLQARVLHDAEV